MGMFVVAPTNSSFPQYHSHPHSHYLSPVDGNNAATALGVGVIPILAASNEHDLISRSRVAAAAAAASVWQSPNQSHQKNISFDSGGTGTGSGSGTATCQDCGNQSKKDCTHQRCRTCCKSRGFDCATHVKSTWVPAARRRERQMITSATGGGGGGGGGGASSGSTSGPKKPRLISSQTTSHTSTSNTPPQSFDTSSSRPQEGSMKETLPGQVRAPAVFKCVKVTAVEDGEDEFAYQAAVKIGGHLFKGFLYDHGVESRDGFPTMSDLHLGGGGGGDGGGRNGGPILDPNDVYGASVSGGMLGGSSYGNTMN